jgi:hypothetical protein
MLVEEPLHKLCEHRLMLSIDRTMDLTVATNCASITKRNSSLSTVTRRWKVR